MNSTTAQAAPPPPSTSEATILIRDRFETSLPRGGVVGSACGSHTRRGVDVERVLSVDHGALRIEPLMRPGWARSGLAYGPFQRQPGLAMAVLMDNGHNLSQSYRLRSWIRQTVRWFRGSDLDLPHVRFYRWLWHRPRLSLWRKMRYWRANQEGKTEHVHQRENLAVGFYPSDAPADPVSTGSGVVIHASKVFDNGELWARVGGGCASTCTSLQNLTSYFVVVLRERGAVYYAASLPHAHAMGAYPSMRPIALDTVNADAEVFAGIHQAVLGEIGFTMDSRVHGVSVAELGPGFDTTHAADVLVGEGELGAARRGGRWRGSGFRRTSAGAEAAGESRASLQPGTCSSLIHAMVEPGQGFAGLAFRSRDESNGWEVRVGAKGCTLLICEGGVWAEVASAPAASTGPVSIQVVDHGSEFTVSLNGAHVFNRRFVDGRFAEATGVGIVADRGGRIRDFEAHPREVRIPAALDLGAPWNAEGTKVLVQDDFTGPQRELAGHTTTIGGCEWRKDIGKGNFEIAGNGSARVNATVGIPSPGRTVYTIPWSEPGFADVDFEMTPPGTARGQNQRGRGGVVFWQDRLNYFFINLWLHDNLETASISTFFCLDGFDDLYDAIWTCIGPTRVTWGVPFRLRSIFDGNRFLIRVNEEPVLYRRLTDVYPRRSPLKINRVGLFANWEWGTDTGTVFKNFIVRGR